MFEVYYHPDVVKKDIPKLPKTWRKKIRLAIEKKLTTRPEIYGKPLRQSIKGYRKLRVGDYRVIFTLKRSSVYILLIGHRSDVYERVQKRV